MMYACEIVSATPEKIVVESPKRFETKYMRESAIGLTGEVVLYLHDPRRRNRQAATAAASRSSSSARRRGSRSHSIAHPFES